MNLNREIQPELLKKQLPELNVGDTVRVYLRIVEKTDAPKKTKAKKKSDQLKTRVRPQLFEGVVIAIRKAGIASTFTVRKISYGVGVERIFPLYSPRIEKIEISRRGKVRRAKLYYLRKLAGKAAKVKAAK